MALEKVANKIVETDVLVVGGGIAGCPAAAKAAGTGHEFKGGKVKCPQK